LFEGERILYNSTITASCRPEQVVGTDFQNRNNRLILLERGPEVPVVQVAAPDTKIRSEAEPAQVRSKEPSAHRIDLAPDIGKIANSAAESKDVDSRSDWTAHGKVQGSPDQVQSELNAVKGGTLLGESDSLRVDGSCTSTPRTVSRVAHSGI
jgi:hypothetical protein